MKKIIVKWAATSPTALIQHAPGSGIRRVQMLPMGINIGIAVDGSASNDSSDMLAEVRQRCCCSGFATEAMRLPQKKRSRWEQSTGRRC